MKIKNILAILLVVCMLAAIFAACEKKEDNNNTPTNQVSDKPAASVNPEEDDDANPFDGTGELVTIDFWLQDNGNNGSGSKVKLVEAAMNEITERDYNIHVNYVWVASADYGTQINLSIANKESVDIAVITPNPAMSWLTMYSNGAMLDMAPLLDSHGQDLKELLGETLLNANKVGDGIYGLSNYRLLNASIYFYFRDDILDAAGARETFDNMTSWSDYEELLAKIKAEGSMYPTGGSGEEPAFYRGFEYTGDDFSTITTWDMLGDNMGLIWSDQDGHVESAFARETVHNQFKLLADWNAKEYIYPDSAFTKEGSTVLVGQGVFAGGMCMSEFGVEATKTQQTGVDVSCLGIGDMFISTMNAKYFGMYIPITATEPEAAMTFLNALYTRADMMNILNWGVENETYVVRDGIAYYPEGTNVSTCGYHTNDFLMGNQFLTLPWEGSTGGKDYRDLALENFKAAPYSRYMGLTVDTSKSDTLVAAVTNVRNEFYFLMANGQYTEDMYNEFLAKLDAAGIDEYVALYQDAVSEFIK